MRIRCVSGDRDKMLRVMEKETGTEAVYTGLPFFSYRTGCLTLTRDGHIEYDAGGAAEDEVGRAEEALRIMAELGLCEAFRGSAEDAQPEVKNEAAAGGIMFCSPDAYSGRTLLNLMCILSARQQLINRALDLKGSLHVQRELVERLTAHPPLTESEYLRSLYGMNDAYRGVEFARGRIIFTCFNSGHIEEPRIHRQLADVIMRTAESRSRIKPFTRRTRNSKYTFRIWLNSVGMTGPEYEEARRLMLSRLSGCSDRRRPSAPAGKSR